MLTRENTKTLYDLLHNAGTEYASRIFLQYERNEVFYCNTYSEIYADSCHFGAAVAEQAEHPHVAILGRCSYPYLVAFFGTVIAGGVAIPLDVNAGVNGIVERLNKSEADVLIYDWDFHDEIDIYKEKCPGLKDVVCINNMTDHTVMGICKSFRNTFFIPKAKEEECAVIIFTSGTTGHGKGVMLSHGNLIDNVFNSTETDDQDNEVALNILPIHHVFCLSGDIFLTMRYGSKLCLCPDPSRVFQYIDLFRPTVLRAVPMVSKAIYNRIVMEHRKHPEMTRRQVKDQILGPNFHKIISGGGYLAKDLSLNLIGLGITIGQGYGMSECSPKISAPDYERLEKLDSVGRLVEGCKVRIVDGEIQVSSPSVMMGYYHDEELTKEALTEDGWLCTGDLGYVDEEDFLYLTGRKKNLIILSNGENIAPEGIENLFDDEVLVKDILVYGEGDTIAAEVYPNYEYAQQRNIYDVEIAVQEVINRKNATLPPAAQIMKTTVRKHPFKKTSSNKIIRDEFFKEKENRAEHNAEVVLPVTDMQKELCSAIQDIIGVPVVGTTEDLYEIGLDSMGSVMLIEEIETRYNVSFSLSDLIENKTVLALEQVLTAKASEEKAPSIDLSVREQYPLTNIQLYFGYIIAGNTTGNLPFMYKLDRSVDLERFQAAVLKSFDIHPILKANIHSNGTMLTTFRDDSRQIPVPIEKISDEEWEKRKETLIVPFKYTEDDDLVHAYIFETETSRYFFIDVAHIIGDGVSMGILLKDINKIYCGEEVRPEKYTFFEYELEDYDRRTNGTRERDVAKTAELMKGIKFNRSILNKRITPDAFEKKYGAIRTRFSRLTKKQLLYFCNENGVSENVMFVSAFNYLIYLFSDQDDVFANSIHSGRTDSRYAHMVGALFMTYYCRFTRRPHETVMELLKETGTQIMKTMENSVSQARQGEMFFQFQGDILGINTLGGAHAERYHVQLDALPFHMQVFSDDDGYYIELRYWENRFDRKQLEIFLECYEYTLIAMMNETSVRRLKRHLPEDVFPKHVRVPVDTLNEEAGETVLVTGRKDCKPYILDESYQKKPFGAWGRLYIKDIKPAAYNKVISSRYSEGDLYETDYIARILPDGTLDFLENNGRTVVTDGTYGLQQFDLKAAENALISIDGIESAAAYLYQDPETNEMSLGADLVKAEGSSLTEDDVRKYAAENFEEKMVPKVISF